MLPVGGGNIHQNKLPAPMDVSKCKVFNTNPVSPFAESFAWTWFYLHISFHIRKPKVLIALNSPGYAAGVNYSDWLLIITHLIKHFEKLLNLLVSEWQFLGFHPACRNSQLWAVLVPNETFSSAVGVLFGKDMELVVKCIHCMAHSYPHPHKTAPKKHALYPAQCMCCLLKRKGM